MYPIFAWTDIICCSISLKTPSSKRASLLEDKFDIEDISRNCEISYIETSRPGIIILFGGQRKVCVVDLPRNAPLSSFDGLDSIFRYKYNNFKGPKVREDEGMCEILLSLRKTVFSFGKADPT